MHSPQLFIPLSADGYLGCFHLVAIVKSTAVNTHVLVAESLFSSLREAPLKVKLLGCTEILPLMF